MSYTRPSASAAFASWNGASAYSRQPGNSASAAWVDASEFSVVGTTTPELESAYILSASGAFDVTGLTAPEFPASPYAICAFRSVVSSLFEGVARVDKNADFNILSGCTLIPVVVKVTTGEEEQQYADINMRGHSRTIMRFRSGPWPW